jgi:hypothetical protein
LIVYYFFKIGGTRNLFPQRNRMIHHPGQQYQVPQQFTGYQQRPVRRGLFGGSHQGGVQGHYPQIQYYQPQQQAFYQQYQQPNVQPLQAPKQSIFRNEQGQIDFQKIGGGVQTAMGLVNQVSPMVKMLGGFFSK